MTLSFLIFIPLLFGFSFLFMRKESFIKKWAGIYSVGYFLLSLGLFLLFDPFSDKLQLVEKAAWMPFMGVQYFIGIDGLSFWFVILTGFLTPLTVLSSLDVIQKKVQSFYICLFIMVTAIQGSFLAMDTILFYIFFESSLIPLYFIIGVWGGKDRIYSAVKFFVYTALGSLFLLAGIVALMNLHFQSTGQVSASLLDFYRLDLVFIKGDLLSTQNILFLCFFIAFAVKLPMVPLHTWLPLAHVTAPSPGSAWLAGVILKLGAYGFLRFLFPLFPESVELFAPGLSWLGAFSIIYGALMALSQSNMKKLVAYSSVSHMGYILLGLFSLNIYGITGAFYQMLAHALSSSALFLGLGMMYKRTHSLDIADYKGWAYKMPILSILLIGVSLSVIALPGTGGFIAEFFVLIGAGFARYWGGISVALLAVILSAGYMLYLIHRVFFGTDESFAHKISDLSKREIFVLLPLILLVFYMGIFPNSILKFSSKSLEHLYKDRRKYELNIQNKALLFGSADLSQGDKNE